MKKLPFRKKQKEEEKSTRITNETVAEHRERILAGGRRFKYPHQYARHRLVITTILISLAVLVALIVVGWWQLYPAQNRSDFFYRITKVLPLPVASVDGESVRYSDYLMRLNSSLYYLRQKEQLNLDSPDGKRQVDFYKGSSLEKAEADAYAAKLARSLGITVTDQEVTDAITSERNSGGTPISEESYNAVILDYYNWSPSEYQQVTKNRLLREKVAYAIDKDATATLTQVTARLKTNNGDLEKIANELGGKDKAKAVIGAPGLVPLNNQDGGLSNVAVKLEKGKVSGVVKSTAGDGYYFIKLLDKTATQISYEYLKIPLTTFSNQFVALQKDHKIHRYINVRDQGVDALTNG